MARPRLVVPPRYLWVPPYKRTNGDIAAEVGEQVGLIPDGEQRLILDTLYAENDEPGIPAFFEAGLIASRQNIKTAVFQIAALTDLFVMGDELVVWTAHLFKTARKAFDGMVQLIENNDDFRSKCRKPRTANGDEAIELLTGEKIEFHARSKGGGRGLTGDKVIYDEALFLQPGEIGASMPTLATIKRAQVRYASSAGILTSDVLRDVRDRGRACNDPTLAWLEWVADVEPCESDDCTHRFGVPGCALDRMHLRRMANPTLDRRIPNSVLDKFRRAMPPMEFAREFLGWWEDPPTGGGAIDFDKWQELADPNLALAGVPPIAIDVTPARDWTSIGAGAFDGESVAVELLEHRPGTSWVIERAKEISFKHGCQVGVDPGSPAGALLPDLRAAGVPVLEVTLREYTQACGDLYDAVENSTMRHRPDPDLDAAVTGCQKRTVGEAWAWDRKGDAVISPLVAVTIAAYLAKTGTQFFAVSTR